MHNGFHGPEPVEAALVLVCLGAVLGSFSLLALGRVLADLRRGRQEEGLMRERLARWRWMAERDAAERVVARQGGTERDPSS